MSPNDTDSLDRLLQQIGQRIHHGQKPKKPSSKAAKEDFDLAVVEPLYELLYAKLRNDVEAGRLENVGTVENLKLRRRYAMIFTWLTVFWLITVIGLVVCTGLGVLALSDTVLQWLIGGVALDLVGLLFVIARNLFPDPKQPKQEK